MSFSTDQVVNFHQVFDVVANHCENLERFGLIYQPIDGSKRAAINVEMLLKILARNKKLTSLHLQGFTVQVWTAINKHVFDARQKPFNFNGYQLYKGVLPTTSYGKYNFIFSYLYLSSVSFNTNLQKYSIPNKSSNTGKFYNFLPSFRIS